MKKSDQIKALQAECDRLAKERDAYREALSLAHAQAKVLADLVALSDAGQVQIHMTHVDEGLPVYEVSWRKPGWSPPPIGPDIAAAHHSLSWPVVRVLEMAQPYIEPPPDPRDVADPIDT